MHKKLAADLTSIAHSILQMKNKEDIFALKEKAYAIYEKLAVLAYVEEYINETPNPTKTKEELIAKIEKVSNETKESNNSETEELVDLLEDEEETQMDVMANDVADAIFESVENEKEESFIEQPFEELEKLFGDEDYLKNDVRDIADKKTPNTTVKDKETEELFEDEEETQMDVMASDLADTIIESVENEKEANFIEQPFEELEKLFGGDDHFKNDVRDVAGKKIATLDDELKDIVSVDETIGMFEKVTPKKSLNDQLQDNIQIGLNDRIAFVKHLFNGDQNDFNRVVSQLNTLKTEKEAKKFINKMIKPDYNWVDKEEYEERFLTIIERKFL